MHFRGVELRGLDEICKLSAQNERSVVRIKDCLGQTKEAKTEDVMNL